MLGPNFRKKEDAVDSKCEKGSETAFDFESESISGLTTP